VSGSPTPGGPLRGVTAVEFGHVIAGPFAGLILAELGARVIKLEHAARPDESRLTGPHYVEGRSLYYLALNWGKESIAIDLSRDSGRAVARRLALAADVVIDNFRPGVMRQLGLDHDTLAVENPRTITCSITGFGETGPYAGRAAYDYTVQAISGVMSLTGPPDRPPARAGIAYADHTGGLAAALAVCAALVERDRTGRGRHIDLALLDVHVSMLSYLAAWQLNTGQDTARTRDSAHASLTPAQNFATRDGHVSLFIGNDAMWGRLARELGDPRLADESLATNAGRLASRDALVAALEPIFASGTTAEWVDRLNAAGVACAPVNTIGQALAEPQVEARGLVTESRIAGGGSYRHVAGPLASLRTGEPRGAPDAGQDARSILLWLGYSGDAVAELLSDGTVTVAGAQPEGSATPR
jgi:crotonobetainyl-CoA:carnitine CoA-transferase CaiB-like acyl-CoA transferase